MNVEISVFRNFDESDCTEIEEMILSLYSEFDTGSGFRKTDNYSKKHKRHFI